MIKLTTKEYKELVEGAVKLKLCQCQRTETDLRL